MIKRLGPLPLKDYLQNAVTPPLLLDVREGWEFERCNIPGSKLIPMGQIPNSLALLDPAQEIAVICHHGVRSMRVAAFLEQQGFEQLINLEGGIDAWAREVDQSLAIY